MTRTSRGDPSKGPGGGGGGDPGDSGTREGPSPEGEEGFNRVSHYIGHPDYKRVAPPTFVAQLPLQRALMMAVMLSKWKVNVLESVYQEKKPNVSRKNNLSR